MCASLPAGSAHPLSACNQQACTIFCIVVTLDSVGAAGGCREVLEGKYYPAASMFTLPQQKEGASVTLNFGAQALSLDIRAQSMVSNGSLV